MTLAYRLLILSVFSLVFVPGCSERRSVAPVGSDQPDPAAVSENADAAADPPAGSGTSTD